MDLHYSQTTLPPFAMLNRFTTLWIYTILKPIPAANSTICRFTTLWIYTILKRAGHGVGQNSVLLPYGFTLFSNEKNRETSEGKVLLPYGFTLFSNYSNIHENTKVFYYLMDLHYSQT